MSFEVTLDISRTQNGESWGLSLLWYTRVGCHLVSRPESTASLMEDGITVFRAFYPRREASLFHLLEFLEEYS
jgi:hypothetical protein